MRIKVNQPLRKIDGEKIYKEILKDGKVVETKDEFLLKDACVNALLANDDKITEGVEKMKRYLLASKIQQAKELELKSEEIVMIKEAVGKNYGALIVGQVYQMLEKND